MEITGLKFYVRFFNFVINPYVRPLVGGSNVKGFVVQTQV